ncbi:hypothetical protein FD50_GL000741 [Liquorilactobacillus satsumensis DSM 16230 = JCM 12392]|uniref:Uncharacterized protein n=1 Tax=Liquorilactobacillus satsumensis DSM 16230 = JCM 12392 TaxID=1423801 RepID=A0A0R1UZY2_9LACO|nr:hypothetical protein FD50_GL000741 [Liquorilactobacillus satsumensis DSM 16230 = JCM 12392]
MTYGTRLSVTSRGAGLKFHFWLSPFCVATIARIKKRNFISAAVNADFNNLIHKKK